MGEKPKSARATGDPPRTPRRARTWLGRLGLTSAGALAALLVAEVALRILGVSPDRWSQPRYLESEDKRAGIDAYPDDPRGYFPLDLRDDATRARLDAVGVPDLTEHAERTPHAVALRYTEELCRGADVPEAREGMRRILVVGDSFAEGQGVREEDVFAALLDARLTDAHVINCGRRGYDFPELRERFDTLLGLAPDLVVYAMTLNDTQQSEEFHARQRFIDDWILDRRRMVADGDGAPSPLTPRLFALVADRIEGARVGAETTRWYQEMVGEPNRAGFDATIAHITAMRQAMLDRGGELVVVLWPLLVELAGDYPFAEVHQAIGDALSEADVPFHDTLSTFRSRDEVSFWVHSTDRHPNERAHALFADAVADALALQLARAEGGGS